MTNNTAETVLKIDNVSKKFRIKKNLPVGSTSNKDNGEFFAIKNLSFDIKRGEICGLIGRNGAGKTTLLELLSGIIKPTEGEISIYGRTASVIDIGTGMHRDLSGLENIFLAGEILGMKRKDIEIKLPEIIAFSELANFMDLPVKHYSSGMFMRLAFSVITHLDADIMLIDEIIGVGDIAFSEKTTDRIIEICKQGRSAIIATHSLMFVKNCCNTAVYLKNGILVKKDSVDKIEELYLEDVMENKSLIPKENSNEELRKPFKSNIEFHSNESEIEVSKSLNLLSAKIRASSHDESEFSVRDKLRLEMIIDVKTEIPFILSVHLNRHFNQPFFCMAPELIQTANSGPGSILCSVDIDSNMLNQGLYTMSVFIADRENNLINHYKSILVFKVFIDDQTKETYGYSDEFAGPIFRGGNWSIKRIGV